MLINKHKPTIKNIATDTLFKKIGIPDDEIILHKLKNAYFHKDILKKLYTMSSDESISHIIFYGPSGCGKKTIIDLFLEMLYDDQVHHLSDCDYNVTGSGNTTKVETIKQSNYHIVIKPKNNNFDRHLIQDVVKAYARRIPLNIFTTHKPFKTVLINDADELSHYAQTSLRRTMEKFSGTCRFIMRCKSLSKIIAPLRSRCFPFRITAPTNAELLKMLLTISAKDNIDIDLNTCNNIVKRSNGHIKRALWDLESIKLGFDIDEANSTSYEEIINETVELIVSCKLRNIFPIRENIYNIIITNINTTVIIRDIVNKLIYHKKVPLICKLYIPEIAAISEHNLVRGRRDIMHLDYCVIEIMDILNKYINKK
uniref:DNA polymerase III delta subunit n=1 Tax=Mimivirus LCMiAC01 TaxID=2506608 RepID=A0A481YYS0_9VIRU|nr:MAG: DNA polymerase III delta subunit [Mimivirus LCMiAC01]